MTTTSTRATIARLLSNMSDGKEIRAYLQRFSALDQTRFAVIKIGGAILKDQMEETASALAFLHTVGLTPVVIHGGGGQLDAALKARGLDQEKIDGLRPTSAEALDVARDVFIGENIRLVEAVRAAGVSAQSLAAGAVEADYLDKEKFGFVGEPSGVRLGLIRSCVASGAIPILTCLGIAPGGQLLNLNADAATRALVGALEPMKIVFLTSVGGLLNAAGEIIHSINLASDYEELMAQDWVADGMRVKLDQIKRLLDEAPLSSSVSITTPSGLARELFTHGGSGTLIRRGEAIMQAREKSAIDPARARALIEAAFSRSLREDWWPAFELSAAYFSESYRAGAFLTDLNGATVLDKFAVLEDARGEGLARVIWRRMTADHPRLFWRSRTANGFNAFYADVSDGCAKIGPWTVFWKGEQDFSKIAAIAETVAAAPESFA